MQLNLLYICIEFIGLEIQIRRYWDIYTVFKVIRFEFTSGVSGVREKKMMQGLSLGMLQNLWVVKYI